MTEPNLLIIAASERNADLYYATRFIAPDPFVFIKARGKKYLLVNDLELDRAKKESSVSSVISLSKLSAQYKRRIGKPASLSDLVAFFIKKLKTRSFTVPADFPLFHADRLRRSGIKLSCKTGIFFDERLTKSKHEVRAITCALRATERSAEEAISILKRSKIKNGFLYFKGQQLTSERLRSVIHRTLLDHGCTGEHTIVSCANASASPHEHGSGPLKANQPIVMDIFPRHDRTHYYADFTRTVVRGKASKQLKEMYVAVKTAQDIACKMIRHGISARVVHETICRRFENAGFKTGTKNGKMRGFFHSTGHGLGLEIHEPPRVGPGNDVLKTGQVVTVEPGLYYPGIGGVRLEDMVLITKNGCVNLTKFPKKLEI